MQIAKARGALAGVTAAQAREQFLHDLLTITGDTRLLMTPKPTDGLTSLDESLTGRTVTHNATIAARLAALGLGYAYTLDGTSQYATAPDTANLSFGNGSVDSAFSGFVLANVTDTAALRVLLGKFNEYSFAVSAADQLIITLVDTGGVQTCSRLQDVALTTQGAWALYGFTFSAASGGATAANALSIYVNGLLAASTATNNASYVAMGDKATVLTLAANNAGANSWTPGSFALAALCQTNLSASNWWAIKKLINAYYGLSL